MDYYIYSYSMVSMFGRSDPNRLLTNRSSCYLHVIVQKSLLLVEKRYLPLVDFCRYIINKYSSLRYPSKAFIHHKDYLESPSTRMSCRFLKLSLAKS